MSFFAQLKHFFIPNKENGYKPNFLEKISVGVLLFLILSSFTLSNIHALLWIGSDFLVSTVFPAVVVDVTNEYRKNENLDTLIRNPVLDTAATLKAKDMVENGYFAHYSPLGISPWYWFDQVSYNFVHAGENLAVHFTESDDVVDAWIASPSHKANIVSGNYTEIGVGTAEGTYKGFPTVFVVQMFGTPRDMRVAENSGSQSELAVQVDAESAQVLTLETSTVSDTENVLQASFETIRQEVIDPQTLELTEEKTEASTTLEAVHVEEAEIVFVSDMATTTRGGVPSIVDTNNGASNVSDSGFLARLATQPSIWLEVVYVLLATLVLIALILSVVIEWRRQHPVQIAYAGGLLVVMALLLYIHTALTGGATIV